MAVRLMHWIMAGLIITNITLAWLMTPFGEEKPYRDLFYFLHKSFGVTLLALIVIRIVVRLRATILPLPTGLPGREVVAAKAVHKILYALLLAMPVLGYVQSSTYEFSDGVHFFGLLVPELIPDNDTLFKITNTLHRVLGYTLLAFVVLHVGGALKHRFFDKPENDVLSRML